MCNLPSRSHRCAEYQHCCGWWFVSFHLLLTSPPDHLHPSLSLQTCPHTSHAVTRSSKPRILLSISTACPSNSATCSFKSAFSLSKHAARTLQLRSLVSSTWMRRSRPREYVRSSTFLRRSRRFSSAAEASWRRRRRAALSRPRLRPACSSCTGMPSGITDGGFGGSTGEGAMRGRIGIGGWQGAATSS
ncbi:hypothetical protein HDK90DRAFT_38669 [Phyllosticta capitalensis]|uniref:Uncharacterized protein n=1 Tax=Phyllosticta capitalensis TaxID=121624 RepID=A0ABR1Z4K6_9PEZI